MATKVAVSLVLLLLEYDRKITWGATDRPTQNILIPLEGFKHYS
ncbi:hypothetical protein [Moorena sp. SIOASIH]|nr:hypothetical protein [Moorena sp. SIOASIH]